jgi:hypothetical protein
MSRIISQKDPWRSKYDNGTDGLITINKLVYTIDSSSLNPADNQYTIENPAFLYINIKTFLTETPYESQEYFNYDLREPKRQIIAPNKLRQNHKPVTTTDDWSTIPYYPTTKERRIKLAEHYLKNDQDIPLALWKQIQEDKKNDVQNDAYNRGLVSSVQTQLSPQVLSQLSSQVSPQVSPQLQKTQHFFSQANQGKYLRVPFQKRR